MASDGAEIDFGLAHERVGALCGVQLEQERANDISYCDMLKSEQIPPL